MRWTAIKLRDLACADHLGRPRVATARADLTLTENTAIYRSFAQVRTPEAMLRYALAVDLMRIKQASQMIRSGR